MVSLTSDGKRQLVRLRSIVQRLQESFLVPLDRDERQALHATLERVAATIGWSPEPEAAVKSTAS